MLAPRPLTAPASAAAQKVLDKELSFSRHVEIWFKEWVEGRKLRSAKDIRRVIDTDLKPWFKDKPINKISRDDINEMIKHLAARYHGAANHAFRWLSSFFSYASDKKNKHLPLSPMIEMKMPYKEEAREHYLPGSEIRYVWEASAELAPQFRALVRILLLTGQRLREVAEAQWSEINMDKRVRIIPGARTKNKLPHLVPLTDPVLEILAEFGPRKEDCRGFILTTTDRTVISGFSKNKEYGHGGRKAHRCELPGAWNQDRARARNR